MAAARVAVLTAALVAAVGARAGGAGRGGRAGRGTWRSVVTGAVLAAAALVASTPARGGTVTSETFSSPTLGRPWAYTVYLPAGYERGRLRYPVMYLLHGHGGDEKDLLVSGGASKTIDRLIAERQIPPAVFVFPSGGTSWYVDAKERMETAFVKDLVPEVERRFRVMRDRRGRIIGGVSMGGYGALRFALKYPQMFGAAALVSPAIYVPEPPPNSASRLAGVFGASRFEPEVWRSRNYPSLLDGFRAAKLTLPLYVGSGDRDELGVHTQARQLHELWRAEGQPVRLAIHPGEHTWEAFNPQLPEALRYAFRRIRWPAPAKAGAR